jgi:hypothetical protein
MQINNATSGSMLDEPTATDEAFEAGWDEALDAYDEQWRSKPDSLTRES